MLSLNIKTIIYLINFTEITVYATKIKKLKNIKYKNFVKSKFFA